MKPRTRLQVRVNALSDALPEITGEQKCWAFKHCLNHVAYRTKTKTACLDCGHEWATGDTRLLMVTIGETHYDCPNCGTRVTVEDTRKKKHYQRRFFGMIDVVENFQVCRLFEIHAHYKAGTPSNRYMHEVCRLFIDPDGKDEIVAKHRSWGYSDSFHGDLEIRERTSAYKYNLWPHAVYPGGKYLPIYKRNGFKGNFHDIGPYSLFKAILTDTRAETLLKSGQVDLLAARLDDRSGDVNQYWDSIKICIRRKYKVKEAITWLDYLKLLHYFKKDLRSEKYVCPKNLKKEHNQLAAKKTAIEKRESLIRGLRCLHVDDDIIKNMSTSRMQIEYDRLCAERNEAEKRQRFTKWLKQMKADMPGLKDMTGDALEAEYKRLKAEHDEIERLRREAEQLKKAEAEEREFLTTKQPFFGLLITDQHISIKVLESLQEFIEEANTHNHCVFSNKYYAKPDSLILSASVDGKPTETIELSLSKMKIIQSRGLNNVTTRYNKQIAELLEKNMKVIRKRYADAKKQAKQTKQPEKLMEVA